MVDVTTERHDDVLSADMAGRIDSSHVSVQRHHGDGERRFDVPHRFRDIQTDQIHPTDLVDALSRSLQLPTGMKGSKMLTRKPDLKARRRNDANGDCRILREGQVRANDSPKRSSCAGPFLESRRFLSHTLEWLP